MKNIKNIQLDKNELHQLIGFVFWGGLNTAVSFAVYCAFIYFGTHIYIASIFGLIAGIFLGHYLNKNNVFKSKQQKTIYKYIALWLCLYLVNITLLTLLIQFGLNKYISGLIAAVLLVPVSFLAQKSFIFR